MSRYRDGLTGLGGGPVAPIALPSDSVALHVRILGDLGHVSLCRGNGGHEGEAQQKNQPPMCASLSRPPGSRRLRRPVQRWYRDPNPPHVWEIEVLTMCSGQVHVSIREFLVRNHCCCDYVVSHICVSQSLHTCSSAPQFGFYSWAHSRNEAMRSFRTTMTRRRAPHAAALTHRPWPPRSWDIRPTQARDPTPFLVSRS